MLLNIFEEKNNNICYHYFAIKIKEYYLSFSIAITMPFYKIIINTLDYHSIY